MSTLDKNRIGEVIEACADNMDWLTKWEQDFIRSISDQWERRHLLSEGQENTLEKIYVEKIP
jgi:hypothetical protein